MVFLNITARLWLNGILILLARINFIVVGVNTCSLSDSLVDIRNWIFNRRDRLDVKVNFERVRNVVECLM